MAVVGAGVVGCASALELARAGVAVALLEAEPEPALGASATNSGILHTGFDSPPGELETELILASARARETVVQALGIPVSRCGALMSARSDAERERLAAIVGVARRNGVLVRQPDAWTLEIPGEAVTDPVLYTLALANEAERQGAGIRLGFELAAAKRGTGELTLHAEDGQTLRCRLLVNCAGLGADAVARLVGDDSFSVYPRKGEFLVFEPPAGRRLGQILLPIPSERTKGVLVFPTLDGKVVAGPTAVDLEDKHDWSVRPAAPAEILAKAIPMYPSLEGAEPSGAYAGLRPAGRGFNYLIARSRACPQLVNVAGIRSTGLSASAGIARRVAQIVDGLGIRVGPLRQLRGGDLPPLSSPWYTRVASYRGIAT